MALEQQLDGGVLVAQQHVRAQLPDVRQARLVTLVGLDSVLDVGGLVMDTILATTLAQQQRRPLRRLPPEV